MFEEQNDNSCVYINLFKLNKLNKDHREINMRAFNWNLRNFVFAYVMIIVKETKFPGKYKRAMWSLFTDNTILCLFPEGAKWSKNVVSSKKVSLA